MTNTIQGYLALICLEKFKSQLILKDPKTWTSKAVTWVEALPKCQILACNLFLGSTCHLKSKKCTRNHCLEKKKK